MEFSNIFKRASWAWTQGPHADVPEVTTREETPSMYSVCLVKIVEIIKKKWMPYYLEYLKVVFYTIDHVRSIVLSTSKVVKVWQQMVV